MIITKGLLNNKETRELIYFNEAPVFKCPYAEIDTFYIKCKDYNSEGVNYKTCCYNRDNCKFKQEYKKTPADLKALKKLNKALKCTLPFGKMKGKSIQEVLENNPSYLYWLMGIDSYGYLASSLLTCSWIALAEEYNRPSISLGSWGSPDENYGYGHWDDYPEYF